MEIEPTKNLFYDKYKDKFFIEKYIALWSYGYLQNILYSEELYQKINALVFQSLEKGKKYNLLDVGCGVGRTTADIARRFPNATITAIDKAELMIEYARKIVITNDYIEIDIRRAGFPKFIIKGFGLLNVIFKSFSLEDFQKSTKDKFDIITSVNFIDRVSNVEDSFKIVFNLLKDGGVYVFSSPLNFTTPDDWATYGSADLIKKIATKVGFKISYCLDNVIYRELLDARGAYEQYFTLVMKLIK